MLLWRGFWNLLTLSFTTRLSFSVSLTGTSFVLMVLGCFNSVVGNPGSVALDNISEYCIISTLFQSRDTNNLSKWKVRMFLMLDAICTIIVEILNILLWFAIDAFNDLVLPSPPEVSKVTQCSLAIALGLGFGLLACFVQVGLLSIVEGRNGDLGDLGDDDGTFSQKAKRKISHWVISSLALLSCVLHWYGLWKLLDYFFLPQHPIMSNLVTAGAGIAGLCMSGASRLAQLLD